MLPYTTLALQVLGTSALSIIVTLCVLSIEFSRKRNKCCCKTITTFAFFHPHCSAGGGGERVLWKAIEALGQLLNDGLQIEVLVYTSDDAVENYSRGKYTNE